MSFYKINFNQLRQQPEISEMISALERAFEKWNVDFYLVGAVARDVWMHGINKIAPRRTTGDIDFAVFINKKGVYEELKEYLIQVEGFYPSKENSFVLRWKDKTEVDLLPFGAIEDANGTVTVHGTGYTSIHVPGFKEVYEAGLPEMQLGDRHQIKFCTLPGIVVLKLIAWDDRPEARRDDIKDISDILHHFFDMYADIIYDNHNDLFGEEDEALIHIAARVMGREISQIARRNNTLFKRIEDIISLNTGEPAKSEMAKIMIEYFNNTLEDNVLLLNQLKLGLKDINQ